MPSALVLPRHKLGIGGGGKMVPRHTSCCSFVGVVVAVFMTQGNMNPDSECKACSWEESVRHTSISPAPCESSSHADYLRKVHYCCFHKCFFNI